MYKWTNLFFPSTVSLIVYHEYTNANILMLISAVGEWRQLNIFLTSKQPNTTITYLCIYYI